MKGRPAEGREGLLRPCWLCLLLQAKKEAEIEKTKDDDAAEGARRIALFFFMIGCVSDVSPFFVCTREDIVMCRSIQSFFCSH